MGYDLIIFDCDGTLVDSEYLNNLATIELLAEHGVNYTIEHALTHFVGRRFSEIMADIKAETGLTFPDDLRERYVARANALMDKHLKPMEDASELVEKARQNTKITVVSNGERNNVLTALERTGLKGFFEEDHIVTGLMGEAKPAPDLFLLASEKMDVKPEKTLVIEDSIPGITGAVAAGMQTWGFTGSHSDPGTYAEALKQAGATRTFESLIHIHDELFG